MSVCTANHRLARKRELVILMANLDSGESDEGQSIDVHPLSALGERDAIGGRPRRCKEAGRSGVRAERNRLRSLSPRQTDQT
jgi:hypothetical protein